MKLPSKPPDRFELILRLALLLALLWIALLVVLWLPPKR
jgi:hypothetical protein